DLSAGTPDRIRPALVQLRTAVADWMKEPNLFSAQVQGALRPMLRATGSDVEQARIEVEQWFDDMMDRVSGWYKRKTQAVQVAAALALAIALDIDTVLLARVFWSDSALRSAIVADAEGFARNPPPSLSLPPAIEPAVGAPRVAWSSPRVVGGTTADVTVQSADAPGGHAQLSSASRVLTRDPATAADAAPWPATIALDAGGTGHLRVRALPVTTDTIESVDVTVNGHITTTQLLVAVSPDRQFDALRGQITSLGLPLRGSCRIDAGTAATPWWCDELLRTTTNYRVPLVNLVLPIPRDPIRWIGWLITAIATSFGAPFWFDLLKKIITVRSAGRAPEEIPTAPKAIPTPR